MYSRSDELFSIVNAFPISRPEDLSALGLDRADVSRIAFTPTTRKHSDDARIATVVTCTYSDSLPLSREPAMCPMPSDAKNNAVQ